MNTCVFLKCWFIYFKIYKSGVYTSSLFNDLDFYLGQILSLYESRSFKQRLHVLFVSNLEFYLGQILPLYEAKYLDQIFSQTFCFVEGQQLAQIKFQIVKQIGCVDAA